MTDELHPKIWLVSEGEYSAYHVVAVFDDDHKADGERFAELIGGKVDDAPLALNPTHREPPAGQSFFIFTMLRDGETSDVSPTSTLLESDGNLRKSSYRLWTDADRPCMDRAYWELKICVYARDEQHAIKVANEIRIQILAGAKPTQGSIP